ncbi:hypothetical protein IAE22_33265, partial [Bacillus sp. S34]|nr:hypothetical protein [Bacillus sp. S34]
KTYGIEEQDLGKFYAQRTILKREVVPENVANAVYAICTDDFSHTTGLHVPVDDPAGGAAHHDGGLDDLRGARTEHEPPHDAGVPGCGGEPDREHRRDGPGPGHRDDDQ